MAEKGNVPKLEHPTITLRRALSKIMMLTGITLAIYGFIVIPGKNSNNDFMASITPVPCTNGLVTPLIGPVEAGYNLWASQLGASLTAATGDLCHTGISLGPVRVLGQDPGLTVLITNNEITNTGTSAAVVELAPAQTDYDTVGVATAGTELLCWIEYPGSMKRTHQVVAADGFIYGALDLGNSGVTSPNTGSIAHQPYVERVAAVRCEQLTARIPPGGKVTVQSMTRPYCSEVEETSYPYSCR
jgi:hypothetical protein